MRPLFKAILIVLFLGIFFVAWSVQAQTCKGEGEGCTKDEECCDGAICVGGVCKAGLFTRGQTRECVDKGDCSRCDFLVIVKNLFQFLVQIAGALAVLGLIISGIMYMTGGGIIGPRALAFQPAPAGLEAAKKALTAVIIGFLIVLFAWTMITWIMNFLGYRSAAGPWYEIDCSQLGKPPS